MQPFQRQDSLLAERQVMAACRPRAARSIVALETHSGRTALRISLLGKQPVANVRSMEGSGAMPELLSEPDEDSFGAPDVAEPIRVFVLGHFADEFRAAFTEPGERIVNVLHGKHDA